MWTYRLGYGSVVEHLPSMHKALGFHPQYYQRDRGREAEGGGHKERVREVERERKER